MQAVQIDIDEVCKLQNYHAKALFTACETDVFDHSAKCLVLDFLPDNVAEMYWDIYEEEFEEEYDCTDEADSSSNNEDA